MGGTLRGPLTFTERLSASAPSGLHQPRENLLSSRYTGPQVESGDGRCAAYFNTSSFRVVGIGTRNAEAKAPAALRLAAPGQHGRPPLVHPLTRLGAPGTLLSPRRPRAVVNQHYGRALRHNRCRHFPLTRPDKSGHPLPKKERAVIPPKGAALGWGRRPPGAGKPDAVLVIGCLEAGSTPHPSHFAGHPLPPTGGRGLWR